NRRDVLTSARGDDGRSNGDVARAARVVLGDHELLKLARVGLGLGVNAIHAIDGEHVTRLEIARAGINRKRGCAAGNGAVDEIARASANGVTREQSVLEHRTEASRAAHEAFTVLLGDLRGI